jgi:hypothetical protein
MRCLRGQSHDARFLSPAPKRLNFRPILPRTVNFEKKSKIHLWARLFTALVRFHTVFIPPLTRVYTSPSPFMAVHSRLFPVPSPSLSRPNRPFPVPSPSLVRSGRTLPGYSIATTGCTFVNTPYVTNFDSLIAVQYFSMHHS